MLERTDVRAHVRTDVDKAVDTILGQGLLGALLIVVGFLYFRAQQIIHRNYETHAAEMKNLHAAHAEQLERMSDRYNVKAETANIKGTELATRTVAVLEAIERQQERRPR